MALVSRIAAKDLERIANILKTVAHPLRLQIIDLLAQKEKLSVTEIYEKLGVEQSLTSHHLVKMKDKGILACERDGKSMMYSLTDKKIIKIIDCIENCNF